MALKAEYHELYDVAQAWVNAAFRKDGSLFTPGKAIWSLRWLRDVGMRLGPMENDRNTKFWSTLEPKLENAEPETIQLMAELLFVHFLAADRQTIRGETKLKSMKRVLDLSSVVIAIPDFLKVALDQGVGKAGPAFNANRLNHIRFLISLVHRWKISLSTDSSSLVDDPWAFRRLVDEIPGDGVDLQRNALLHLVHPTTFETAMTLKQARDRPILEPSGHNRH